MSSDQPKTLDTESDDENPTDDLEKLVEDTSGMHATREEAVAEHRADDASSDDLDQDDDSEDFDHSNNQEQVEPEKRGAKKIRVGRPKKAAKGSKEDPMVDYLSKGYQDAMKSDRVNLKAQLAGNLLFRFRDTGRCLAFEGPSGDVHTLSPTQAGKYASDCTIEMTENHLEQILDGDLNPQVAMLSDKLRVDGQLSLAIYFFNIFDQH